MTWVWMSYTVHDCEIRDSCLLDITHAFRYIARQSTRGGSKKFYLWCLNKHTTCFSARLEYETKLIAVPLPVCTCANFRPVFIVAKPLKMPLGRPRPGCIVLDEDPSSFSKGAQQPSPIFGPCLLWPNGWMAQDATWYGDRHGPRRRHCVRWGPSCAHGKGHSSPYFSAHVYCGQTAGCIRIPLGTEVCLGPGDIVLHEDPAPTRKGAMSILAKLWFLAWPTR